MWQHKRVMCQGTNPGNSHPWSSVVAPGSPSLSWACSWALGVFWQPVKRQKNKEPNLPQRKSMWSQA